ncbi:hypothetical protein [Clostridium sp.]|uniref:hypothetical protein n=1 Tax=Clostridium sp. TaxID=1506 RepID=UPI00263691E2|nr:hypothetical protein [Clostridium sp.]
MKLLKKYYPFLIFILVFTFGLLRARQISNYEVSIGKPTMSGAFAFYAYFIVSIILFISSLLIKILSSIKSEKFNINVKILLITIIGAVGLAMSTFILYFIH